MCLCSCFVCPTAGTGFRSAPAGQKAMQIYDIKKNHTSKHTKTFPFWPTFHCANTGKFSTLYYNKLISRHLFNESKGKVFQKLVNNNALSSATTN